MINRGSHHVVHDRTELMKRMQDPLTVDVLDALQVYFDTRDRRKRMEIGQCEMDGIKEIEKQALLDLINKTGEWLKPTNAHKALNNRNTPQKPKL